MTDFWSAALFGLLASASAAVILSIQSFATRPPRPFIVKDGSVIGEYLTAYCAKTGLDIDKVCLVAHDLEDDTTIYHIKSLDMFPEIWLNES